MNIQKFCEKFEILKELNEEIKAIQDENNNLKLQLDELKQTISKFGYKVEQSSEGVFELIKDESAELPMGDFINPIPYEEGMNCNIGLFYTDNENIWECILTGVPNDFNDTNYFDIK